MYSENLKSANGVKMVQITGNLLHNATSFAIDYYVAAEEGGYIYANTTQRASDVEDARAKANCWLNT